MAPVRVPSSAGFLGGSLGEMSHGTLTLIRMRDAWRAVGAAGVGAGTPRKPDPSRDDRALAGAGPVTEILSCIGEGEGEGEGGTGVTVRTQDRRPPFSPIVAL